MGMRGKIAVGHAQSWQGITAARHRVEVILWSVSDTKNPRKDEYAISYQFYTGFKKICTGRFVFRSETWLFLTCHNYWIVCRLVRDDDHPFLAYSPRNYIEPSTFNQDMQLDT